MLDRRRFALAALLARAAGAAPVMGLRCSQRLSLLPGGRARLELELHNGGKQGLRLLGWGTPFEGGWFRPFSTVSRDGQALAYRGAMMKRGEPTAEDYFDLGPGRRRRVRLWLDEAYEMAAPGLYRVEAQWGWADLYPLPGPAARPLAEHSPQAQDCAAVEARRA